MWSKRLSGSCCICQALAREAVRLLCDIVRCASHFPISLSLSASPVQLIAIIMPNIGDYGSLDGGTSPTDSITGTIARKKTLTEIPEERSLRFEGSMVTSVFSGHGVGAGAGSLEQQKLSSYSRRQLFVLACVCYGNFWVAACVSLQAPFFPHEAEQKGASSTIYGLIFGVYELMIITMSPLFGKMVAKMSPNILVQMGLLVCGSATVTFG